MRKITNPPLLIIATLAVVFLATFSNVSAVPVTGFEAGRIIDDVVMANKSSMNVTQIQAFLNSKVPICDNWGTKGSTPTSRRDATLNAGYAIPMTCLKEYVENGKSSAQIIYDIGQEYNINPQVLIVLLQKEQAIVTDEWPWENQYLSATGYGCPDTATCDTEYYGFTNQVRNAAKMFRRIMDAMPTWYTPYTMGNNYIQYNPNTDCGGTVVNIQNRATQALYNYTPYQPNSASLNAGYVTGDSCSSYGNRNFYSYFTDWFGSTTAINGSINISRGLELNKNTSYFIGDTVVASFDVSNYSNYEMDAGGLGICAKMNGEWFDFGFINNNNIPAEGTVKFEFSKKVTQAGSLQIFTCSYNDLLGGWAVAKYPYNPNGLQKSLTITIYDNPLLGNSVIINPSSAAAGQSITAGFSIANDSNNPMPIGTLVIAARDASGNNVDFPAAENVIVPANSSYDYLQSRMFTNPGIYTYFIANYKDGVWSRNYPKSSGDNLARKGSFTIR